MIDEEKGTNIYSQTCIKQSPTVNIEMLFYSSSPHPVISFYNEPPYPLKIYSAINK